MTEDFSSLLAAADQYYTARLQEFGATHRGVDWNSTDGQLLRFRQLLRVAEPTTEHYSVNDFGCGYGGLYGYLVRKGTPIQYNGFDVSAKMIEAAKAAFGQPNNARFHVGSIPVEAADYSVASGIFHVKQDAPTDVWLDYLLATLEQMHSFSRKGFAFNCLTAYSDKEKMREDLFYANPGAIFDHCMRRYTRNVALLHDYGLYEFTVIVRL